MAYRKHFGMIGLGLCLVYGLHACNFFAKKEGAKEAVPETLSYNFDIRPILSDKCFACHGPDANKREADLRLDMPESAFRPLKDNPTAHALVAGKPESSELFLRVSPSDTSMLMPPPASNLKKLNDHEIKLIEKWIKQGAKYEKHWAFSVPKKATLPQVENNNWVKNDIDALSWPVWKAKIYHLMRKRIKKHLKSSVFLSAGSYRTLTRSIYNITT